MVKAKKTPTKKRPTKKITKKGAKKTIKNKSSDRPILYPKLQTFVRDSENPLTPEFAKELLGWEEEGEVKFDDKFLLRDDNKTKIRCYNNLKNRRLTKVDYLTLKQEHLRRRWQLNGEPIILGKTGLILTGQHTLISLILAQQEKENDPDKWPNCPDHVTMEKLIVAGISEEEKVVNTIDTCRPRSLGDVIYRSGYFEKIKPGDRNTLSKMTDYAVRLLWDRTGVKDAFNLRRTHAESIHFLEQHPKILECVKHVFEESVAITTTPVISPGYLSGMLYLMACGQTDPTEYHNAEDPNEYLLDFGNWDQSCDFTTLLIQGAKEIRPIKLVINKRKEDSGISLAGAFGVLANGWLCYHGNKPITTKNIALKYHEDEDGISHLLDNPTVGGIDRGSNRSPYEPEAILSPEEVEARKEALDASLVPE